MKVVDFGLAKDLSADTQLTLGNGLTGTPAYLAPETLTDPEQVDARSDIYAVGAMAYYLVTGSDVFVGTSVVDVLRQHLNDIPRAPSERMGEAIDPDFEALVLQCLSKHPEVRPGSAVALRDRLDSIAEREVWSPKVAEEWWSVWEGSRRNQKRGVNLDSKRETRHLTVGLRGGTRG